MENAPNFWFWLCSSGDSYNLALATMDGSVIKGNITAWLHILPAFNLDTSSVLFASSAKAGLSTGNLTVDSAFTLRYKSTSFETAIINMEGTSVSISDAPNGTLLVVQNSDGAYAVNVMGDMTVNASDITCGSSKLTSFDDCKVWLESTNADRITTATMAVKEAGYKVDVQNGSGDGTYAKGEKVTIIADPAPSGKQFKNWTVVSGNITLADSKNATTSFAMPAEAVVVKANYSEEAPKKGTIFNAGNYKYKITNANTKGKGTVTLLGFSKGKSATKVSVPKTAKYKGIQYKVTVVGKKAFRENKKIKSVTIGNNVTKIESQAFYKCKKMQNITLGTSLKTMGDHIFCFDTKLRTITIKSKKLTKVGKHSLHNCTNLKIKVPSNKVNSYKKLFRNQSQKKNAFFVT